MINIFGYLGCCAEDMPAHLRRHAKDHVFLTHHNQQTVTPPASLNQQSLVMAGEIFNAPEHQQPALYALRLLREHGYQQGLQQLNGNFALGMLSNNDELLIARDPFGVAQLYYARLNGGLVFASKLQDITSIAGFDDQLDFQALTAFIKFNFIPGSYTIYRNVKKLLPGHMLLYKNGRISINKYFDQIALVKQGLADIYQQDENTLVDKLLAVLRQQVARECKSGGNGALLLSGGVDSSMLAALLAERVSQIFAIMFSLLALVFRI